MQSKNSPIKSVMTESKRHKAQSSKRIKKALFKYSEEICKEAVEVSNQIIHSLNTKIA
jgi:hypothetical protein